MEPTIQPLSKNLNYSVIEYERDTLPRTIAARTRHIYDLLVRIYPLSTYFFHSRAHRCALEVSGIRDGMRVLEVATGSGEMFRRLVRANRRGKTMGLDLSPNMAAHTLRRVRRDFPEAWTQCQAVDARYLPFQTESFDAVVACYLLELLSTDDILLTLSEFHRVLRPRGVLTLVCIGENAEVFNKLYHLATRLAPAFWGRQVEQRMRELVASSEFRVVSDRTVRQTGYPSRVLAAVKGPYNGHRKG
jgi:ubiquinone/menaquinone biosynthesis C-methylase UbiE